MANTWLRLWHDMPNDPKFRTIARVSGQPVSLVLAVYLHLLVDASRNVTRGHATVTDEDLASALDTKEADIKAVKEAMQGRVLGGMDLLGWEKRQPKREDTGDENTGAKSAAERKAEQRAREKQAQQSASCDIPVTQCHDESRNVTLDKDKEEDKEKKDKGADAPRKASPRFDALAELKARGVSDQTAADWLTMRKAQKAVATATVLAQIITEADKAGMSLERALAMACLRNWRGFRAAWIKDDPTAADKPSARDWI